jgi:hypothetical protein
MKENEHMGWLGSSLHLSCCNVEGHRRKLKAQRNAGAKPQRTLELCHRVRPTPGIERTYTGTKLIPHPDLQKLFKNYNFSTLSGWI